MASKPRCARTLIFASHFSLCKYCFVFLLFQLSWSLRRETVSGLGLLSWAFSGRADPGHLLIASLRGGPVGMHTPKGLPTWPLGKDGCWAGRVQGPWRCAFGAGLAQGCPSLLVSDAQGGDRISSVHTPGRQHTVTSARPGSRATGSRVPPSRLQGWRGPSSPHPPPLPSR